MTPQFRTLEYSTQRELELPSSVDVVDQALQSELTPELADRALQYEDASLEEIFDLLEESIESYVTVAPNLPPELRRSARKETEFFAWLFQERIAELVYTLHPPESYSLNAHLVA
ncbi:MAG TPA: hypothetical protein V6C78_33875 [Crinalium sp.]|jgi:hypothetical protein